MPRPVAAAPGQPTQGKFGVPPRHRSPAPGAGGGSGYGGPTKKKGEPKKKDPEAKIAALKERLAKGHRLTDDELAQLEMAAVARWTQLEREDEEAEERRREEEAEKEKEREKKLHAELGALRKAAAADRANLERAGSQVAAELKELREMRDAAMRDRQSLEEAVSSELAELRAIKARAVVAAQVPPDFALRQPPTVGDAAARGGDGPGGAEDDDEGAPALASAIYDTEEPQTTRPPPEVAAAVAAAFAAASSDGSGRDASGAAAATAARAGQAAEEPSGAEPARPPEVAAAEHRAAAPGASEPTPAHTPSGKCWSSVPPPSSANAAGSKPAAGGFGAAAAAAKPSAPPRPKKPKGGGTAPPKDPLAVLRDASFEEFANERRRLALQAGEEPKSTLALEEVWESLPNAVRVRFEKLAAQKLKAAGGADGAASSEAAAAAYDRAAAERVAAGLLAPACGGSAGGAAPAPLAEAGGAGGATVGRPAPSSYSYGGRYGRVSAPAEQRPPRSKPPPPPPTMPPPPEGNGLSDSLSALALAVLGSVLASRAWLCGQPPVAEAWERAWREEHRGAEPTDLLTAWAHAASELGALLPHGPGAAEGGGGGSSGGGGGGGGSASASVPSDAVPPSVRAALDATLALGRHAEESAAEALRSNQWTASALTALQAVPPAVGEWRTALGGELRDSCNAPGWLGLSAGTGMLHVLALVVGCLLLRQLMRQLTQRLRRCCRACCARNNPEGAAAQAAAAVEDPSQPLLPLATAPAASVAPTAPPPSPPLALAPWTSLAVGELFLAGYASSQFASGGGDAAALSSPLLVVLFGPLSTAHLLMLWCSALLIASAAVRAIQLGCHARHVAQLAAAHAAEVAAAAAPPGPKATRPASKPLPPHKAPPAPTVEEERPLTRKPRVPTAPRPAAPPPPPKTPPPKPPPSGWLAWLPALNGGQAAGMGHLAEAGSNTSTPPEAPKLGANASGAAGAARGVRPAAGGHSKQGCASGSANGKKSMV